MSTQTQQASTESVGMTAERKAFIDDGMNRISKRCATRIEQAEAKHNQNMGGIYKETGEDVIKLIGLNPSWPEYKLAHDDWMAYFNPAGYSAAAIQKGWERAVLDYATADLKPFVKPNSTNENSMAKNAARAKKAAELEAKNKEISAKASELKQQAEAQNISPEAVLAAELVKNPDSAELATAALAAIRKEAKEEALKAAKVNRANLAAWIKDAKHGAGLALLDEIWSQYGHYVEAYVKESSQRAA